MTKNILTVIFCMAGSAAICWLCDWKAKVVAWMLIFWVVIAVGVAGATLSEQIRAKKNNRRQRKMAISSKKALEAAKVIVDFCNEQRGCQNCIFRLYGADHWKCHMYAFDLQDVLSNIEAKKKNHGFI